MACIRRNDRFCSCTGNLGSCDQLSLCSRSCDAGAIMVGNGVGAKNGILFKTAVSLEETGKIDVVVLDKTGTITKGRPTVTDILPGSAFSESELLTYAYILEKKSEHPLAHAILKKAEEEAIQTKEKQKTLRQFPEMV